MGEVGVRARRSRAAALVTALLAVSTARPGTGAEQAQPPGEWRYIGGDASTHATRRWTRSTPRTSRSSRSRGPGAATTSGPGSTHLPLHAALCRRPALHRRRPAAHRRGDRSRHRRDALDLSRAAHHPLRPRHAEQLRQRCRVRRGGRPAGHLSTRRPRSSCTRSTPRPASTWTNWGTRVPLPGFPASGVVDMLPDLVQGLGARG